MYWNLFIEQTKVSLLTLSSKDNMKVFRLAARWDRQRKAAPETVNNRVERETSTTQVTTLAIYLYIGFFCKLNPSSGYFPYHLSLAQWNNIND